MSLNGFDVSSAQSGINTGKLQADFVIVKATQGTYYKNPSYNSQIKSAAAAGKKLGVYHFIDANNDVKKQADYFLGMVKSYIGKAVLFLDFEDDPNSGTYIQNQAGVGKGKQWLDYVYQQTGVRPLLYTGLACENRLDWSAVVKANYALWVAQYNNYNLVDGFRPRDLYGSLKHWKSAAIFQYTSSGRLAGWGGNLDFNVFYGDKAAWDKYAGATSKPAAKPKPKPATTGPKWVKESKTYTLKTAVKLRKTASTSAGVIAVLPAGSTVKTDRAIIQGGYRWVRQPRSGGYGYLATGPKSDTLKYVKSGVAKAYYKVKSGDSWWVIAQRYHTTIAKLTKLNGATINTVIHPGDKIRIK